MISGLRSDLADAILWLHVGIIVFNLFGLVAVPVGAARGWAFVRVFWWRALHVALLAVVALQALFGRACLLTIWQNDLLQRAGAPAMPQPLIERWVARAIYWPLPFWTFIALYVAVFIYALLLWKFVPPIAPRFGR
jgi:hypothetical protein